MIFLIKKFEESIVEDVYEANKKCLELTEKILKKEVKITPYKVARFLTLCGHINVEIFISAEDTDENPFNDEEEYKGNILYLLNATGDAMQVTKNELIRLIKTFIRIEEKMGGLINEEEKEKYDNLISQFNYN